MMTRRALLIVGHGTITDPVDVPEFLRRIRRGRPASAELVEEIRRRYRAIGRSPLLDTTESLGRALATRLGMTTRVSMRFWDPLVEDVVHELLDGGVTELCVLPVAPFSVHVYVDVVARALQGFQAEARVRVLSVEPYGDDPGFVEAQAAKVRPLLAGRDPQRTELVLSAHSLPRAVIAAGDPYQKLYETSARAIAGLLGWDAKIVYQSQGADGGDWLGPTLDDALVAARDDGKRAVVDAPVGFLADHVETLFDLDIEAAGRAKALGLGFERAPTLGADPALVDVLASVVERAFAPHGQSS
ncbi:MAG TPA: ferrochelatase [Polyangiaceae bacterium]|jgi:ferrochelatase|nr:ferrochelatase [Polyangiaceae bacterium]